MEREFKISGFFKIIWALPGIVFSCILLAVSFQYGFTAVFFALLVIIITILLIRGQNKRRINITDDSFTRIGLFERTEIPLKYIQGYRFVSKGIRLYYGESYIDNIFLTEGFDYELNTWVRENLVNLDDKERIEEYEHIIEHVVKPAKQNNSSINVKGPSIESETLSIEPADVIDVENETENPEEELDSDLERYFKVMIAYDMIAAVGLLFNLVSPNLVLMGIMTVYPLIGLAIIATSNTLVRLVYKETSPRHSLFIGVMVCCSILCLTRVPNASPYIFNWFGLLGLFSSVSFIAVAYFVDKAEKHETYNARRIWLLVIGLLYGYGSVIQLEYIFGHFVK